MVKPQLLTDQTYYMTYIYDMRSDALCIPDMGVSFGSHGWDPHI